MSIRTMRRTAVLAAAIALAVVFVTLLCGCQATVTVTAKYQTWSGYYVCTGDQPLPCTRNTTFSVTQAEYDQARVGGSATIDIPDSSQ